MLNIHIKYTFKIHKIAMFYGLLTNIKGNTKRESDVSYFHWGPFVLAASHSETPLVKHFR